MRERLAEQLDEIEAEVNEAREERDSIQRNLDEVEETIRNLQPFRSLPLNLEDYRGYETLEVFVGEGPDDLPRKLDRELDRYAAFTGQDLHAIFVHEEEAEDAQELFVREGFRNAEIPEGEGSPSDLLREARQQAQDLATQLEQAERELSRLADQHGDLLLCAEEDLSIEVEKAEAPLDFASTERTFVCDCWVPSSEIDTVKTAVSEAANGRVSFEKLDDGQRDVHDREDEPPTRYDHTGIVKPFAYLMETFSTPKYDEIDPTLILSLVFPLFLGFMIGDLGYGLLMLALGVFLYRRVGPKSEAARSLGFALSIAGGWAILFGAIVFKDMLGIPLYASGHGLSWPGLLGLHDGLGAPMIHKIEATGVKAMLALSVLAAFVHLFVGFTFSFVNELGHDTKHAAAQIGWIVTLTGLFMLTILKSPANAVSAWFVEGLNLGVAEVAHGHVESIHFTSFANNLPWFLLAPGVLILVLTEGFMGIMETFSLLANIISYTRLAGVAVAKGGMVAAFNSIFLTQMVLGDTGIALVVVGFALFVLAQLIVFVLGLISSGIQGIRLNYVEFFLKFFEGGGKRFSPFGRERKFTTASD